MSFFSFRLRLYPLVAILSSLFLVIFGLVFAKEVNLLYFLLASVAWIALFGGGRSLLRVLPIFVLVGGLFALIAYYSSRGDWLSALSMVNRFLALFLGASIAMSISVTRLTRSLTGMHAPRSLTLGLLISFSFVPLLKAEVKRVNEAMRTRGAGSLLNPRILYRAFLVPFIMRLVNISDTLALSVETRGFALKGAPSSIYKKERVTIGDVVFPALLIAGAIMAVCL